jgi:hypothetical protein
LPEHQEEVSVLEREGYLNIRKKPVFRREKFT